MHIYNYYALIWNWKSILSEKTRVRAKNSKVIIKTAFQIHFSYLLIYAYGCFMSDTCKQCPWSLEVDIGHPKIGSTHGCEQSCGCLEPNLSPL